MIQVIDYGGGNLKSVANALEKLGFDYEIIETPEKLRDDAKIIFPGVGAAGSAMSNLRESGFGTADLFEGDESDEGDEGDENQEGRTRTGRECWQRPCRFAPTAALPFRAHSGPAASVR